MIVKELDVFASEDKLMKAGRVAEEQMAFYLRRSFSSDRNIRVFHGIRLEKEDDAAQIDHLILHKYGIIIVESKSVTTQIQVNEYGEWMRQFNGSLKGMPSPILQAKRQGEFLKSYLEAHAEVLLSKFLGMQSHFIRMPVDILVAISDSGVINRSNKLTLNEVCKADQASDKIKEIFEKHRQINSVFNFNLNNSGYELREDELAKISDFLLKHHKPIILNASAPISSSNQPQISKPKLVLKTSPPKLARQPACRNCQSNRLTVMYGKYGYYFKCLQCDGNTPINTICNDCGRKQKIRKSTIQFYTECESCQTSELFYTNPVRN
jgi:hypothetical protein